MFQLYLKTLFTIRAQTRLRHARRARKERELREMARASDHAGDSPVTGERPLPTQKRALKRVEPEYLTVAQ